MNPTRPENNQNSERFEAHSGAKTPVSSAKTAGKSSWGGYRPNAGRKSMKALSPRARMIAEKMLATERRYAKKYGKSIGDMLLDIASDPSTSERTRRLAQKLLMKYAKRNNTNRGLQSLKGACTPR